MNSKELKIKCLVIEDDTTSQCLMQHLIEQTTILELISCVGNAQDAKQILDTHRIDLLFLDINLPGISGIDLLNSLQNHPPVIFTTADVSYAADSFNYNVVDYLLKPITHEHFNRAVQRALEKRMAHFAELAKLDPECPNLIEIPIGCDSLKVKLNTIIYLQSWGNYVKVFTTEKMILATISTQGLIDILPASRFVRVHKSFTINKSFVTSRNHKQLVVACTAIPIGISYRQSIQSIFKND